MKTRTISFETRFLLIAWLVVAVAGMTYLPTWVENVNKHALVGHGQDALDAAKCLDGSGTPAGVFKNAKDYDPAREAHICYEPSTGRWFVMFVTALGAFVTAYRVEKAHRKSDMVNYVHHRGFK